MKRLALIAVLGVLMSLSAAASELTDLQALAEQGNALAQHTLGTMYSTGKGVPENYAAAIKWYSKAAEQGYAEAQNNLGLMYRYGKGVRRSRVEAVNLYREAAMQGLATAQYNLGAAYYKGVGVRQSYAESYVWFSLAVSSGHDGAIEFRDKDAKKLSKYALTNAQRRAATLHAAIQRRKNYQ